MKRILFTALVFLFSNAQAQQDVCCVMKQVSGDSVKTFAQIMSSSDCAKKTGVCTSVPDADNTYCGAESNYKDRCSKCSGFWSGKECLTEDPKLKAKRELEEEAKKKDAAGKDAAPSSSGPKIPEAKPAPSSDEPKFNETKPEDNAPYSREGRGVNKDSNY